jgi:short-subunit dehydrogenase
MICANGVFSQMIGQKRGKVVNISSFTVYWCTPNFLHYVASKAALVFEAIDADGRVFQ